MTDELIKVLLHYFLSVDASTIVLLAMLLFGAWVCVKAQRRSDFDFADMLRDERNKPSALRISVFTSLAVSSWILVYGVINKSFDAETIRWTFTLYILVWSGAKVAEELVKVLANRTGNNTVVLNQSSTEKDKREPDPN